VTKEQATKVQGQKRKRLLSKYDNRASDIWRSNNFKQERHLSKWHLSTYIM